MSVLLWTRALNSRKRGKCVMFISWWQLIKHHVITLCLPNQWSILLLLFTFKVETLVFRKSWHSFFDFTASAAFEYNHMPLTETKLGRSWWERNVEENKKWLEPSSASRNVSQPLNSNKEVSNQSHNLTFCTCELCYTQNMWVWLTKPVKNFEKNRWER